MTKIKYTKDKFYKSKKYQSKSKTKDYVQTYEKSTHENCTYDILI